MVGRPLHGSVLSGVPDLSPLDASSIPPSGDSHTCLQTLPHAPTEGVGNRTAPGVDHTGGAPARRVSAHSDASLCARFTRGGQRVGGLGLRHLQAGPHFSDEATDWQAVVAASPGCGFGPGLHRTRSQPRCCPRVDRLAEPRGQCGSQGSGPLSRKPAATLALPQPERLRLLPGVSV